VGAALVSLGWGKRGFLLLKGKPPQGLRSKGGKNSEGLGGKANSEGYNSG